MLSSMKGLPDYNFAPFRGVQAAVSPLPMNIMFPRAATKAKSLIKLSTRRATAPHFCYRASAGPRTQPPVNSPMVRSKPRAQPKKKPPVDDKSEPIEVTLTVAPAPLFSTGDAVHHPMFGDGKVESIKENKLTITFDGNVTKVIREDFVTRKK